jgi:hypothetical protein
LGEGDGQNGDIIGWIARSEDATLDGQRGILLAQSGDSGF